MPRCRRPRPRSIRVIHWWWRPPSKRCISWRTRTVGERRRTAAALMLLILLGPSCGPKTPAEEAGIDQEITRNILWRYHNDLRFTDVRVQCEDRDIPS